MKKMKKKRKRKEKRKSKMGKKEKRVKDGEEGGRFYKNNKEHNAMLSRTRNKAVNTSEATKVLAELPPPASELCSST